MADDIAPGLLKAIQEAYRESKEADKILKKLRKKLEQGDAQPGDSLAYSRQIGEILSGAYGKLITPEILPNGQMYYNIATRVIDPTIKEGLEDVSDYHMAMQEALNESARIYIKPQKPPINQDRIDGIIERLTGEPFEDISWILGKAIIQNVMQSRVDDHEKADADFHYRSGLKPVIKRTTDGKCCKWCSAHAGTYPYTPDMDREVFRRHANCGCVTAYYPDINAKTGQNVWSKEETTEDDGKENITNNQLASVEKSGLPGGNRNNGSGNLILGKYQDVTDSLKKDPHPGNFNTEPGYKPSKHKEEMTFAQWFVQVMGGILVGQNERDIPWCDFLWDKEFWELKTLEKGTINAINNAIRKGLKQIESASSNSQAGSAAGIMIDISKTDLSIEDVIKEAEHAFYRHKGSPVYIMVIRDGKILTTVKLKK